MSECFGCIRIITLLFQISEIHRVHATWAVGAEEGLEVKPGTVQQEMVSNASLFAG